MWRFLRVSYEQNETQLHPGKKFTEPVHGTHALHFVIIVYKPKWLLKSKRFDNKEKTTKKKTVNECKD